jgi:hypothetical protein
MTLPRSFAATARTLIVNLPDNFHLRICAREFRAT